MAPHARKPASLPPTGRAHAPLGRPDGGMVATPFTRRNLLGALAAAGLLTAAERIGLIRAALASGTNPVPAGLHKIRGSVTVNGQPAREGTLVRAGDTVVTGAGAEALYVIGQDAFLQRESSTIAFGADMANFMRVISGKILSVFGKGNRSIFVATATIGIRGTACYVEQPEKLGADEATALQGGRAKNALLAVADGGTATAAPTYFCLCYGEARVIPTAAPQLQETLITTHHDHPLYLHDDQSMPTMMVSAPVINHTDAELVMLENLVGRWPPFYGKTGPGY
ncbi:MAG: hypothetical protein KJ787_05715 [Gammaproteobacteria bacterium]|nr:hypothetical protein [Gammaproteobacteria bacterium]MBU1645810.1 hypothetical protein [Gammaproteobacteria bacterium]MBU1971318.1 hypothetical protein [Gammaproteobacteria bacterium]